MTKFSTNEQTLEEYIKAQIADNLDIGSYIGDVTKNIADILDIKTGDIINNEHKLKISQHLEKNKSERNKIEEELKNSIYYIDKNLSNAEKVNRISELKKLLIDIENNPELLKKEEKKLEKISIDLKRYIVISQGAENRNMLSLEKDNLRILKLTKDRHDNDFWSVIKLLLRMYQVELDYNTDEISFNNGTGQEIKLKIETATDSIGFYKEDNKQGNNKRLISQNFAKGKPLDVALKESMGLDTHEENIISIDKFNKAISDGNKLAIAYKGFLEYTMGIELGEGYVLDITDSRRGPIKDRGNVFNTGNLFVEEQDGVFNFTIVDPDVFDKDGSDKFGPDGNAVNQARKVVIKRQDDFMLELGIKGKKIEEGKLVDLLTEDKEYEKFLQEPWFINLVVNFLNIKVIDELVKKASN